MATFRFKLDERTGIQVGRPPVGVRMLGPADTRLRADIKFLPDETGGTFTCTTEDVPDAAMRLQVDAGRAGVLLLQTCLLPPSDEPYDLAVELARHRVKTFIVKSEEWQMFDPAFAPEAVEAFEEARHTFTDALLLSDSLQQGTLAARSLAEGLRATDRLAHAHADILLHRRYGTRPASSTTLGTTVEPSTNPALISNTLDGFDVLSLPLRWRDIEVKEGTYDFAKLDEWMQWAKARKRPIVAGPLADVAPGSLPDWIQPIRGDYAALRDKMFDFMEAVVSRYIRYVGIWKVCSGLHIVRDVPMSSEEMLDLTRTASLLVRQYRRGARTMIELDDLFGDLSAKQAGSLGAFEFLDQIQSEGLRNDCIGVRLIVGGEEASERSRDLMAMSDLLDRFFMYEMPILVSACGAPAQSMGDRAGSWGAAWSPERQAVWASRFVPLALSKPFVEAVIWSRHKDIEQDVGFGLIDSTGEVRAAHGKLLSMRRRLRRALGPRETTGAGRQEPHEDAS